MRGTCVNAENKEELKGCENVRSLDGGSAGKEAHKDDCNP